MYNIINQRLQVRLCFFEIKRETCRHSNTELVSEIAFVVMASPATKVWSWNAMRDGHLLPPDICPACMTVTATAGPPFTAISGISLDPGSKISYPPLKRNSSETVYSEQMPTRHYYHPPDRFAKCWYPPTSSLYTTVRPDLREMNPKKNKRLLVPINTIMKLYIQDSECNSYRDHRLKVQSTATTV